MAKNMHLMGDMEEKVNDDSSADVMSINSQEEVEDLPDFTPDVGVSNQPASTLALDSYSHVSLADKAWLIKNHYRLDVNGMLDMIRAKRRTRRWLNRVLNGTVIPQGEQEESIDKAWKSIPQFVRAEYSERLSLASKEGQPSCVEENDTVCYVCRVPGQLLVLCDGPCRRAFHLACAGLNSVPSADKWLCEQCAGHQAECAMCKCSEELLENDDDALWECELCQRHFHPECLTHLPGPTPRVRAGFICPYHYCRACGKRGKPHELWRCLECPVAYHTGCIPAAAVKLLGRQHLVCRLHTHGPPPSQRKRQRVAQSDWECTETPPLSSDSELSDDGRADSLGGDNHAMVARLQAEVSECKTLIGDIMAVLGPDQIRQIQSRQQRRNPMYALCEATAEDWLHISAKAMVDAAGSK